MKNPAILKPAIFQTFIALCFLVGAYFSGQTIMWVFDIGLWVIAFVVWLKYFKIRLLPKWIGFNFATITICIFLFIAFTKLFPGAVVRTLDTVYAKPPYSDRKLKKIEIGSTPDQVRQLLGEPLEIDTIDFMHCLLFTDGPYRLDPGSAEFHGLSGSYKNPYLALWFNDKNEVIYVNKPYDSKVIDTEILDLKEERILDLFGKPKESLYIPTTKVWSYSRIVKGARFGSSPVINARRVYFNTSGKVVKVAMTTAGSYDLYKGSPIQHNKYQ